LELDEPADNRGDDFSQLLGANFIFTFLKGLWDGLVDAFHQRVVAITDL